VSMTSVDSKNGEVPAPTTSERHDGAALKLLRLVVRDITTTRGGPTAPAPTSGDKH